MWSVIAVFLAAGSGGFVFITHYLLQVDTAEDPAEGSLGESKLAIDQREWLELQDRQLLRTGLHEFDQQAALIWENIARLQQTIDVYTTTVAELKLSEEGKRLATDEWAVRYFLDHWGEALPHDRVAKFCRIQLNELMFTCKTALAKTKPEKEKAAYKVSRDTQDKIDLLEFRVNEAKKQYESHANLLLALVAKTHEGEATPPQTLEEAVETMRNRRTLQEWRYPSAEPAGGNEPLRSGQPARGAGGPPRAGATTDGDDSASLYRDLRRNQSAVEKEAVDTTLARDAVRAQDEPPRKRSQ